MTTAETYIPELFDEGATDWSYAELFDTTHQFRQLAVDQGVDVDQVMACQDFKTALSTVFRYPFPPETVRQSWPYQRYIKAVVYIATYQILGFELIGRLIPPHSCWGNFIRLEMLTLRGWMLCDTAAAILDGSFEAPPDGIEPYLCRFAKDVLNLQPAEQYALPLALTLSKPGWRRANNPDPTGYVKETTRRRVAWNSDHRALRPDSADIMLPKAGRPRVDSLDTPLGNEATSDLISALIPNTQANDELDDAINRIALKQVAHRRKLPGSTMKYFQAKLEEGMTREEAADLLGMTKQEVWAADKALQRLRPQLRKDLLA